MNLLFVNYGDFTTNSLNHIAAFARALRDAGHDCIVAVPDRIDSVSAIPEPAFRPALHSELIDRPDLFSDGRAADIVHAWTPREVVRRFVLDYQRRAHARLVVHLEDNEDHLLATWLNSSPDAIRELSEADFAGRASPALSHPRRYRHLLRVADGITHITPSLGGIVPDGVPSLLLPPGLDPEQYHPREPDPALRREIGLGPGEKAIVFTGSATFANEAETRDLYLAVELLRGRGVPIRLVRTGINPAAFRESLPPGARDHVIELGFVDKNRIPALLALADILVQPGRPGPFNDFRLPSKVPEFLSVGRPVVLPAANIGLELRDGKDALLLKEGTPEEIADACTRLLGDPRLARTLAANAPVFARRHFDLATNARSLAAFYAELLARPPGPGSTATVADGASEVSLVLRKLAARSDQPEIAAIAADLAPLVEEIERLDAGEAERSRLQRELEHWRHHYDLAQKHSDHLDRELRVTSRHAANLTHSIKDIRERSRRVQERLQTELGLTRQHAANLEELRDALHRRTIELGEHLARASRARDAAAAKVRAMQESVSWKLTSPLRFLRRHLLDPWRRREASAPGSPAPEGAGATERRAGGDTGNAAFARSPAAEGTPIWHSVDHPQSWSLPPRAVTLRGWCFAEDGRRLTGIRAVLPDRIVEGIHGFKRLDVLASVRTMPQAEYSGWKIELEFRDGDTALDLETSDESGRWHGFFHADLQVGEGFGPLDLTAYEHWIATYDRRTPESLQRQRDLGSTFARQPRISVIMPVYNTPARLLERAIESVRVQTWPHWELCVADDASTEPHVRPLLEAAARDETRIRVAFRESNGHISAASNSALELATGEYIALLDHDDELAPHALFEVAALLNAQPETDYLYSDEDKIDETGRRHDPYFKPDFLPDLFLGQNYTSHLSVYRSELVHRAGGFRVGYEGSQDWDLALRVIELSDPSRVRHIPRVLYHWRAIPGSTALLLSEKNYPVEAARRALAGHFERIGKRVRLETVPGDHWRVIHPLPADPPLVSLIVPTRNRGKMLRRCIESILGKTSYSPIELIVVDNDSDEPAALALMGELAGGTHPLIDPGRHRVRVIHHPGPFNYSVINNRAVHEARGRIVGLLNNDLEVITPGWLEEMTSQALRPEIGCVGAMLYYPNDTIQHAGTILGVGGVAGHAFRDFPRGTEGKFNRARLVQNYSAVTAACLLIRKETYEQVGGLDEKELSVAFNDVDFCLKVRAAGFRNLWTPFAEFYHHESASRGADDTPDKEDRFRREIETMQLRWGPELTADPAYNPNLTLELNDFTLAVPPRHWSPAGKPDSTGPQHREPRRPPVAARSR